MLQVNAQRLCQCQTWQTTMFPMLGNARSFFPIDIQNRESSLAIKNGNVENVTKQYTFPTDAIVNFIINAAMAGAANAIGGHGYGVRNTKIVF